ncbi:MAG TPA: TlpA disulfide reductase family protein [Pyrinomonadaceae bacterium]|nr:TlpA disulfide reductase family protein [Pyrinomonadaceae bacterium]HMP65966.1 TlpA disulfide reductase family protein [Pyrinomonadaceae bacterium]
MIVRLVTILTAILLLSVWVSSQDLRKFKGKLETELSPDMVHIYQRIFEATSARSVKFVPPLSRAANITSGMLTDQTLAEGKRAVFLVEESASNTFLGIDLDRDGTIRADERFRLKPNGGNAFETVIRLPIKHNIFKSFPVFIRFHAGFEHPQLPKTSRLLEQSVWTLAFGKVEVEGKSVLFQYPFDPLSPEMSTTKGLFGIDVDGDGSIRNEQFSAETSYATDEELVFRYGDIYLSTSSIDLKKNEIIVRERGKDEYFKIELEVGKVMPDFKFVDFDGKARSLSEFRGKYLLIDFWGLWCFDCLRETPFHVEAYERFKSRGFDILSINTDEDIDLVKDYMKKNGMEWTQARNDSVRQLIERDYRIQEYPSTLLLDPDGKVLVLDQKQLRGNQFILTLERILPK